MKMMGTLLASAAIRSLTATEARMGRPMRGPDHPAPAAPAPAPEAPTIVDDAPAAPVTVDVPEAKPAAPQEPVIKSVDDLYDAEFGEVDPAPAAPDEAAPAKEDEQPPEPEAEPKGESVQQRIDKATASQREAERQAAEARREADSLRAKYEPKQPEAQAEEVAEDQAPDPDDFEFGEADSEYIKALAKHTSTQTFNELQQAADRKAEFAELDAGWKGAIAAPEVVAEYPDFNEKVVEGAANEAWDCSPIMTVLIKHSPVGPHMAYELAGNAAESARIAALPPMRQMFEMGKLEGLHVAKRSGAKVAAPEEELEVVDKPTPKAPSASKAPPPPEKRSRGAGGQFAQPIDAAYDKMLNEFK